MKISNSASGILKRLKLKILVTTPLDGGSLPIAKFTAAALKKLGHHVEIFEADQFYDGFLNVSKVTPDENDTALLKTSYVQIMGECIIAKAKHFKPDLVIALAQSPISPSVIERLRAMNITTAFWFVEDFRLLQYWKKVAHLYDFFFTIQEGDFFEELKKNGVLNYHYLPQACSTNLYRRVELTNDEKKEYCADISFMGAGYYNRQIFLKELVDFDLKIWGTGWNLLSPLWKKVQRNGERVTSDECIKIFNGGKINLNLHSSNYHEGINPNGDFINPRTFEIASCCGFQLVDYRSNLSECFDIGKEIVTYKDIYDLRKKIKYYLDNPDEREKIAMKGQARVHKEHSFEKRMEEMLLIIISKFEDRFLKLAAKANEVDRVIKEAGENTELGKYLLKFKGKRDLKLADIIHNIESGEGNLSKPESIFLMMNQFLTEKK